MLVFPQLSTGTVAVYPVKRTLRRRTVKNVLGDLRAVVYVDADFGETEWELSASGLTEVEAVELHSLFEATGGREKTFTFLEPAGNLLAQSETFTAGIWTKTALMSVTETVADPWGGTRASHVTNGAPTVGEVGQVLAVPADYQYCVSIWARAVSGNSLTVFAEASSGSTERVFALGGWSRLTLPVSLGVRGESMKFGFRVPTAGSVDVVGMQVDAQPAAGDYQRTGTQGGVRSTARFGMDELTVRARGTDVYDALVRVVSKEK